MPFTKGFEKTVSNPMLKDNLVRSSLNRYDLSS